MKRHIFKIPDYAGGGVYAILNIEDRKAYIGQSSNLKKRAEQHDKALKNGTHQNKGLNLDRGKKLKFIILKRINDHDFRRILECVYMQSFLSHKVKLYNNQPKRVMQDKNFYEHIGIDVCCTYGIKRKQIQEYFK